MKSKLLLSLLALSCLPAQLCATIVRAEIWQRPNGTRIIILGDDIEECPAEQQQVIDCTNYLKSLKNSYVLKLTDLSSQFAQQISSAGIPHDVITFVPDLDCCDINITPLAKEFLADAQQLQATIPAKLKDHYNTLLASFQAHINALRSIESVPSNPDDYCTQCNPDLCLPSTMDPMFDLAQSIFSYMLASRLEHKAANESCLLLDSSMMNALAQALPNLGYKRVANFGTFTPEAAEAMFMEKWFALIAAHSQDGNDSCSCCSDEDEDDGGALETSIMNEVMNHFALNLNDIFKRWTPAALIHTAQRYTPHHTHLTPHTPNMTPTEYRQWSNGYDHDMRNENLPIRGFGLN